MKFTEKENMTTRKASSPSRVVTSRPFDKLGVELSEVKYQSFHSMESFGIRFTEEMMSTKQKQPKETFSSSSAKTDSRACDSRGYQNKSVEERFIVKDLNSFLACFQFRPSLSSMKEV